MTRLNGMPIQTFATITATSDQVGDVSQFTCGSPTASSSALTTPDSLLSIHDQVDADTISGSSHGARNSARSTADRRKLRWKKTASAIPIAYWNAIGTAVNTAVCHIAVANSGSETTSRKLPSPMYGASPVTNDRTV